MLMDVDEKFEDVESSDEDYEYVKEFKDVVIPR
jgi:hypothetical protein